MSKIWPIYQHGFVCGARPRIAASLLLASLAPGLADPAPIIHYAPTENLEHIVALIDRAEHEIDMAAYVLMDRRENLEGKNSVYGNAMVIGRSATPPCCADRSRIKVIHLENVPF